MESGKLEYQFDYHRIPISNNKPAGQIIIHFFTYGGLGDRILFQTILEQQLREAPQAYHIAAIPHHGNEYDARCYRHKPDELWIVPEPYPLAYAMPYGIAERLQQEAATLFQRGDIQLHLYGNVGNNHDNALITEIDPYRWLSGQAAANNIAILSPGDDALCAKLAEALRHHIDWRPGQPIVAINVPFSDNAKYPDTKLLLEVAEALRQGHDCRTILISGNAAGMTGLEKRFDYITPADSSLQILAAVLSLCDLYIGGDSGPTHMASAHPCRIIQLRPAVTPWLHGPYCHSDRLSVIHGVAADTTQEHPFTFDAAELIARAGRLLAERQPVVPATGKPATPFDYAGLVYLGDQLDTQQHSIGYYGIATEQQLTQATYLYARGVDADLFTDDIALAATALARLKQLHFSNRFRVFYRYDRNGSDALHQQLNLLVQQHPEEFFVELGREALVPDVIERLVTLQPIQGNYTLNLQPSLLHEMEPLRQQIVATIESGAINRLKTHARRIVLLGGAPYCHDSASALLATLFVEYGADPHLYNRPSFYLDGGLALYPEAGQLFSRDRLYQFDTVDEVLARFLDDPAPECIHHTGTPCPSAFGYQCGISRALHSMRLAREVFIRVNRKP